MKNFKRSLLLSIMMIFLSGCILSLGVKQYDTEKISMEEIVIAVRKNYNNIRSLKSDFEFSYTTVSDRIRSSGTMYVTENDTLYIEINGAVGETEAIFFLTADSLKAANYIQKLFIIDKADQNSLNRVTGIMLHPDEFKRSLSSKIEIENSDKIEIRSSKEIVVRKDYGHDKYKLIHLNDKMMITEIADYNGEKQILKREYDYFSIKDGSIIPRRIRIRSFEPAAKLTVFYNRLTINKPYKIDFRMDK